MGTIGDRLGADLEALFGGEGEASPKSAADTEEAGERGEAGESRERAAVGADQTPAAEGAPAAEQAVTSAEGDPGVYTSEVEGAAVTSADSLETLLLETVAELSGKDAADISFDDSLKDLDIVGLSLWAVVAELERSLKIQFLDADVLDWEMLSEVIAASKELPR